MLRPLRTEPSSHNIWDPSLAVLLATPAYYRSWPIAATLRTIWNLLPEAFAAHREYEHLMSRGVPHDTALRQAVGLPKTREVK
jgi:hypothetical protein